MNINDFKRKKQAQQKICMLTCYDYPSAQIVNASSVDCVLVGDSVAMTVHGYQTTIMATIEMMVLHTKAVARGLTHQFITTDLPFLSHRISQAHTMKHIHKLMQAGAHAVKIEGADEDTCKTIQYVVQSGIPVMGHIGLTPQSVHQLGGYKVQGKEEKTATLLLEQAIKLEQAGCFAIVLECIPQKIATQITQKSSIATIGIGAGVETDGQVLVWHDVLGMQPDFNPKFVKKYAKANEFILEAINQYANQVHIAHFPTQDHAF